MSTSLCIYKAMRNLAQGKFWQIFTVIALLTLALWLPVSIALADSLTVNTNSDVFDVAGKTCDTVVIADPAQTA